MKRSDVRIRRVLVLEVGKKALLAGLIDKRAYHITPIITYLMEKYVNGEFDEVLTDKYARDNNRGKDIQRQRYAVSSDLKAEFENKAFEENKIKNWCHSKSLIELLLKMYVENEIIIKELGGEK